MDRKAFKMDKNMLKTDYIEIYNRHKLIIKYDKKEDYLFVDRSDYRILPFELMYIESKNIQMSEEEYKEIVIRFLPYFMEERTVPETRQHLKEILNSIDVPYRCPYLIAEKNYALCSDDYFWVILEKGKKVNYDDIKIRD